MKKISKLGKFLKMNLVYLLLFLLIAMQLWQGYKFKHTLALFDSLGGDKNQVIEELSKTRSYVKEFGSDMNEIRKFLLLPTKEYVFDKEEVEALASDDISANFFDFITALQKSDQDAKMFSDALEAIKAWVLTDVGGGLSVVNDGSNFKFINSSGSEVAKVLLSTEGEIEATSFGAEEIYSGGSVEDLIAAFKGFVVGELATVEKNIEAVRVLKVKLLNETLPNPEVQAVLNSKKIILSGEKEDETSYYYELTNSSGDLVGTLSISKSSACLILNDACVTDLLGALTTLDSRSVLEKKVSDRKKQIDDLLLDAGFQATLKKSSMTISFSDETDSRVNYKVSSGLQVYIIYIDKSTGQVMVEKSGGGTSTLLSATDELRLKKKAPTFLLS
ncbi:MAG: hypothetical protein AAB836_02330 [Patescibacteria group bacterium]